MEWGLLWHRRRPRRSGLFTVEWNESLWWAWAVRCGYALTILERFIEPQHHHVRSCKNTAFAMSRDPMNKYSINPEQSKKLAMWVIIITDYGRSIADLRGQKTIFWITLFWACSPHIPTLGASKSDYHLEMIEVVVVVPCQCGEWVLHQ